MQQFKDKLTVLVVDDSPESLSMINMALDEAGIASRRKCDELILQGKVKLNGIKVTELGVRVDETEDEILFEGAPVHLPQKFKYILLQSSHRSSSSGVNSTVHIVHLFTPYSLLSGVSLVSSDSVASSDSCKKLHNLNFSSILDMHPPIHIRGIEMLKL